MTRILKFPPPRPEPGEPVELTDFTVRIATLRPGSATIEIAPRDNVLTYYFALLAKADYDAFDTEEALLSADRTYLETVASQNGLTLEELLAQELFTGDKTWGYVALAPQTTYCFYLYGLSADGVATTTVNKVEFTTPKVEPVDCTFALEPTDVTTSSFKLTVTPSDPDCPYYYDVFPADMWQLQCGSDPAKLPAFIASYIEEMVAETGRPVEQVVAAMSSYGEQSETFEWLDTDSNYYAFAIGLGADGTTTTDPVVEKVTTQPAPMNEFTVEEVEVGFDKATFRIIPSQNEPYVALCELQEYFEGMTDEEIVAEVIRAYGDFLTNHIRSGYATVNEEMLIPEKPYYMLVFGYNYGEVTTPLVKRAFTTTEALKSDCTFEFRILNVLKDTADVGIRPSDDKTTFFFNVIPAATYATLGGDDAAIRTYADGIIDGLVAQSTMPRYEWLSRALERGTISWALDGLEAGTSYYIFAVGMAADGTFTTAPFLSEKFTTQSDGVSIASLEFIPTINDAGASHPGEALVYGWFYPKQASYVLLGHWVGDDSVYVMDDAAAIAHLREHGVRFTDSSYSVWDYVPYGSTVYYVAAAFDKDDLPVVCRETVTPQDPSAASVRPQRSYYRYDVDRPGPNRRREQAVEAARVQAQDGLRRLSERPQQESASIYGRRPIR